MTAVRTSRGRALPAILVAVAVVLVGTAVAAQFVGGEEIGDDPTTSPGSIRNESDDGTSGWAETLRRLGYTVHERRNRFDAGPLPSTGVLVLVAGAEVSPREAARLATWLAGGSRRRLVVVDPPGTRVVDRFLRDAGLVDADAGADPTGREVVAAAPAPETAGIERLSGAGTRAFTVSGAAPIFEVRPEIGAAVGSTGAGVYAAHVRVGEGGGIFVAVADAAAVVNAGLTEGDNAAFAQAIVGPDPQAGGAVWFDLSHHVPDTRPGLLGLLPRGVQWFLAQIALAGLVLAVSTAIRFGPPIAEPEAPPRRRVEFVDALTRAYSEADGAAPAAELIRTDLHDRLRRATRSGPDADDAALGRAAAAAGLDEAAVVAVLGAPVDGPLSFRRLAAGAARIHAGLDDARSSGVGVR